MTGRSKRVLWLLQHRTLMQAEVPILRRLGYEVFVPKVFASGPAHRSSAVSYAWDDSLTIPEEVLARLNRTDFYSSSLPDDVLEDLNEYFGAAFFIFIDRLHMNLFRGFRGALISRPFGLLAPDTYYRHLLAWDPSGVELVAELDGRYWFGASYPTLAAAEPPLLADREVYLPIALPDSFAAANAGSWTGGDPRILFVCPDINVNPELRRAYDRFKRDYGNFDHVIVGKQHEPVDDSHVVGFVPDDQLIGLMRTCALMVYPSLEPRHVQYHPVEAAVIGLPVVFYRESLLGHLLETVPAGAVADAAEGRALAARLLAGDRAAVDSVRDAQHAIAERFSETWCASVWAEQLDRSGIRSAIEAGPASSDLRRFDANDPRRFVPRERLMIPGATTDGKSIRHGIDLRHPNLSTAVSGVHGLGDPESWGRWVRGDRAVIRLAAPLSGAIEIEVTGGSVAENFDRPISLRVGDAVGEIGFGTWVESPSRARATLRVSQPDDVLIIDAPASIRDADGREVSIGLQTLRVRRRPHLLVRIARRAAGATLRRMRRLSSRLR